MTEIEAISLKNKGDEYFKSGKYEEAIKCYLGAVQLDPDYVQAWNNMGYAFSKLGKMNEADQVKEKINELKRKKEQSPTLKTSNSPENSTKLTDTEKVNINKPMSKNSLFRVLLNGFIICFVIISSFYLFILVWEATSSMDPTPSGGLLEGLFILIFSTVFLSLIIVGWIYAYCILMDTKKLIYEIIAVVMTGIFGAVILEIMRWIYKKIGWTFLTVNDGNGIKKESETAL